MTVVDKFSRVLIDQKLSLDGASRLEGRVSIVTPSEG